MRIPAGAAAHPDARPEAKDGAEGAFPRIIHERTGIAMIRVEPGEYLRGAADGDPFASGRERPAHRVRLTRGFYLGETPVTQAEWRAVLGTSPARFTGDRRPVENVSFAEVTGFCAAAGLRLPTEAEWEFAAAPDPSEPVTDFAWVKENAQGGTHDVGTRRPNARGFHDCLGNVWEWCADAYDANAYRTAGPFAIDPFVREPAGTRVARGGSWSNTAPRLRVAYRFFLPEASRAPNVGFRVAWTPEGF